MPDVKFSIDDAKFKRVNIREALRVEPPAMDFVLPGMVLGTVGALVAQGGAGKSWIALEIAIAVAGGPDLLELDIDKFGPVLYLPAEDPTLAISHRLYSARTSIHEDALSALETNLEIVPLMGKTVDIMNEAWSDAIKRMASGKRLVVIDTLRRFHCEDENSSSHMNNVIGALENICETTGASILFLHHTGKGASLNGDADVQQASRGSSVLVDNVRGGQFNLSGMSKAEAKAYGIESDERRMFTRLVQAKSNYGPPMSERWFKREEGGLLVPANIQKGDYDSKEPSSRSPKKQEWRGRV